MSHRAHNVKSRPYELLFEDSGELEHVIDLLREHAKSADVSWPDDKLEQWRANSPLASLEKHLREILVGSDISSSDVKDLDAVWWLLQSQRRLNNLQEACAEALQSIYATKTPADLAEHLPTLLEMLRRVHAVLADSHIAEARENREQRKKAREKKIKPVEERRARMKEIATELFNFSPGATLSKPQRVVVYRELCVRYPAYKKETKRALSDDAAVVGIRLAKNKGFNPATRARFELPALAPVPPPKESTAGPTAEEIEKRYFKK